MAKLPKIKDSFINMVNPSAKTLIKKCNDGSIAREELSEKLSKLSKTKFRMLSDYTMATLSIALLRWSCVNKDNSNDPIRKLATQYQFNDNHKFLKSLKEGNGPDFYNSINKGSYKNFYNIVYLICCPEPLSSPPPDSGHRLYTPNVIAIRYFDRLKKITKWRLHKKDITAAHGEATSANNAMTTIANICYPGKYAPAGWGETIDEDSPSPRTPINGSPTSPSTARPRAMSDPTPLSSSAPPEKNGLLSRARRSLSLKRGRSKSLPPAPVTAPPTDLNDDHTHSTPTSYVPPTDTSNLPEINPELLSPYSKYTIFRYQPSGSAAPEGLRAVGFLDVPRARIYVVDFQSASTGGDKFRNALYEALDSLGNAQYWAKITASDISEWRLLPTSPGTPEPQTTTITEAPKGIAYSKKNYIYVYSSLDDFKEACPRPISQAEFMAQFNQSKPSTSSAKSRPASTPKNRKSAFTQFFSRNRGAAKKKKP